MKKSYRTGLGFGLVSGVLTTLGLLIGLGVSTHSKLAVASGILTIAIVDSLADAFGIHLSQESAGVSSKKHVWEATISAFLSKFSVALTFLVPVFLLNVDTAVVVSMVWGFFLVGFLSFLVSKNNGDKKAESKKLVLENLALFILVILSSYLIGNFLNNFLLAGV